MKIIWSTRGRTWGFRLLRTAGLAKPLASLEEALAHLDDDQEGWCWLGDRGALRFLDPRQRRDLAGRIIPHELVVFAPHASGSDSFDDVRQRVWAEVADEFERIYAEPEPPRPRT